jgi:hypothetical protein
MRIRYGSNWIGYDAAWVDAAKVGSDDAKDASKTTLATVKSVNGFIVQTYADTLKQATPTTPSIKQLHDLVIDNQ